MKKIIFPIVINRKGNKSPKVDDCSVEFNLTTELFDFRGIIELIKIFNCLKPIFNTRYSFMSFMNFLYNSSSVNFAEQHLLKTLLMEYIEIHNNRVSESDRNGFINKISNIIDNNIDVNWEKGNKHTLFPFYNIKRFIDKYCDITKNLKDIDCSKYADEFNIYVDINSIIYTCFIIPIINIDLKDFISNIPCIKQMEDNMHDIICQKFNLKLGKNEFNAYVENNGWVIKELYSSISDNIKHEVSQYFSRFFNTTFTKFIQDIKSYVNISHLKNLKEKYVATSKPNTIMISNLFFKENVQPVIYISDELINSIYLDYYVKNCGIEENMLNLSSDLKEEKRRNIELEVINTVNSFLNVFDFSNIKIKIFSREGKVYKTIKNKSEFSKYFYENNYELYYMLKKFKKTSLLENFLFKANSSSFVKKNSWVLDSSISIFNNYMKKYNAYGNFNSFVTQYLHLDLRSGYRLLNVILEKATVYYNLSSSKKRVFFKETLVLLFNNILENKKRGSSFFDYEEDPKVFSEQKSMDLLVKFLIDYLGLEKYLKLIIDMYPLNTKVLNKIVIEEVYFKRYNYLFKRFQNEKVKIINLIYHLYKEQGK